MKEEIKLTILIPALNEEQTIEIVIKKAKKWMKNNNINGEILVSNNNSTDKTKNIALNNNVKSYRCRKKGLWKCFNRRNKTSKRKIYNYGRC